MKKLIIMLVAAVSFSAMAEKPEADGTKRMRRQESRMRVQSEMSALARAVLNPKIAERLQLSEEQKEKLKKIKGTRGNGEVRELNKKVRAGMLKQAELMKASKIDEAAVMAVIDEVWGLRKEIAKKQAQRIIEVKNVLTPEQIAKALEAVKARRAELRARRERRGEGTEKRQRPGKRGDGRKAAPVASAPVPKN